MLTDELLAALQDEIAPSSREVAPTTAPWPCVMAAWSQRWPAVSSAGLPAAGGTDGRRHFSSRGCFPPCSTPPTP